MKNALAKHGYVLQYIRCLDLMARLYGFADFHHWKHTAWDGPLGPFDEDLADGNYEARFQRQERLMAEAGFASVAGLVLDEVNPTSRRGQPLRSGDESEGDTAPIRTSARE